MRKNFTDKFVRSLRSAPPGKRVEHWDAKVPCFGVRVTEKGHKTYFLYLRWPGSRWAARREIGNADRLPLDRARAVAREWLAKVELGVDPHEERRAADAARRMADQRARDSLFEVLAERWFVTIRGQRRGHEVETDFRREYVERFRGRPVGDITRADVRAVVEAKRDEGRDPETGEGGRRAQARNLLGYGKRFFKWVVDNDILEASPAQLLFAKTIIGTRDSRERTLSDSELRAVWNAADQTPYPYGPLIKTLILTGQRRSEVGDAVWTEFKLLQQEWTIPLLRMKKKRGHLVPYPAEVADILAGLPRFRSGQHLFSTRNGTAPVNGFAKAKERIDAITGKGKEPGDDFYEPWVFHDLRRTVRTNLGKIKTLNKEIRERMVAHQQDKMSQVYDLYDYADEKREGFEAWAARLHNILYPPDSNVVALRR
jgi:integrase